MNGTAEITVAIVFTVVAVVATSLFMGRATVFLSVGLVLSLFAWLSTRSAVPETFTGVSRPYVAAIVIQGFHFLEEYSAGIQDLVPDFFGYTLSAARFVIFNLVWMVVFVLAAAGVRKHVRLALLPVWFMAIIGGIGNGILHSAMALWNGAYFPGLITAMIAFPIGVTLIIRLTNPVRDGSLITDSRGKGGQE